MFDPEGPNYGLGVFSGILEILISYNIFLGKRPLLHGRGIQSPGINYQPRLANENSDHKEHIDSYHRDIDSQTAFVYRSNR